MVVVGMENAALQFRVLKISETCKKEQGFSLSMCEAPGPC